MSARLLLLGIIVLGVGIAGIGFFVARSPTSRAPEQRSAIMIPVPQDALPPLPTERSPAPPLQLQRLQPDGTLGDTVELAAFRGQKVAIVNFWATWCPPCDKEIPDFATMASEAGDNVVTLLVNRGEPRDVQVAYLRERNLLTGNRLVFLDDPSDAAYDTFGGYGMPVTAFITKDGHLALLKSGLLTLEEMRTRIQQTRSLP
ncbi:MAG: thiol-disulfide oxidoreductase [Parcubacteria group bacterium Gr01-1014_38]|nr:MAG: thiol-disulfide oxidoreductase [Parcubacteria group bacterium Gr01-1014_38]